MTSLLVSSCLPPRGDGCSLLPGSLTSFSSLPLERLGDGSGPWLVRGWGLAVACLATSRLPSGFWSGWVVPLWLDWPVPAAFCLRQSRKWIVFPVQYFASRRACRYCSRSPTLPTGAGSIASNLSIHCRDTASTPARPPPMRVLLAALDGCLGITVSTVPIDRQVEAGVDEGDPAAPGA